MNRKFIHYVLLQVTNITIKLFIASLATIAIGGILLLSIALITGEANIPNSFGIYG